MVSGKPDKPLDEYIPPQQDRRLWTPPSCAGLLNLWPMEVRTRLPTGRPADQCTQSAGGSSSRWQSGCRPGRARYLARRSMLTRSVPIAGGDRMSSKTAADIGEDPFLDDESARLHIFNATA